MLLALAYSPWSGLDALPKSGHVRVEGLLVTITPGSRLELAWLIFRKV